MAKYRIVKLANFDDTYALEQQFFGIFWIRIIDRSTLYHVEDQFNTLINNRKDIVIRSGKSVI